MDIATIIGLVGGTTLVVVSILIGGTFSVFINIPGLLIVVGGTIATSFIKFTMEDIVNSIRVAMKAFTVKIDPPEEIMEKMEFYHKNKTIIYLIIFLIIVGVIVGGLLFFPEIFYDQWIWKYYWGPVVADADPYSSTAVHNGVVAEEGYTMVSEITYGLILVISLFAIYKALKRLKITIDWRFAVALMPYILEFK